MKQDEAGCIGQDPGLQDVGDRRNGLIQLTNTHDVEVDRLQLGVQVHHTEYFLVILGKLLPHHTQCR